MDDLLRKTIDNLKEAIDTENIIGKPIVNGDGTIILPVSKLSYGFVAGGGEYAETTPKTKTVPSAVASGGGMTVTPLGFLICGKEKKFISVDKTADNKWMDLLKDVLGAIKGDDEE